MAYIDGFVVAVPAQNKDLYLSHAKKAAAVFKSNGALRVVESWGDDVPEGVVTSFPLAVKKKDDEIVCFSWIEWKNKAARDEGMAKAMQDPSFNNDEFKSIFDGKRMIFGGFDVILDA